MARCRNDFIDYGYDSDGVSRNRNKPREFQTHGDVFVTQNANGDTLYLNEIELKEALGEILNNVINEKGINVYNDAVDAFNTLVVDHLDEMRRETMKHFDTKLEKLTEEIYEAMLSRKIKEEVERRVEEKLVEMRKLL